MKSKITFLTFLSVFFIFLGVFAQERNNLRAGQAPFFHGVASGDPTPNEVMIWTRVTPPSGSITEVDVYWQIATDLGFTNIVNFGKTKAFELNDFSVKVDVCGLEPGTHYYYVFQAFGDNSIIGRTKTAPEGNVAEAKFGVVSCSSYEHGYFNAYESLSERQDLDAILHLGDYIYEYATGGYSTGAITSAGRTYEPTTEIVTLEDYRTRHSHYKLDYQLQLAHQRHPFITTWDDHESANDAFKDGAQNHNASQGPWQVRKNNSVQAYLEWMPVRNPDPNETLRIWRNFKYGNLLDLIVLDSRLWGRDEQNLGSTGSTNRTILGNDQFEWLESRLIDNSTTWKIIPQQVMMAPLTALGIPVNADQWDGYQADRNRLINYLESNNQRNAVVLTGDIHTAWANNIPGNSLNRAAVEFVTTSVTSPGAGFITSGFGGLLGFLGTPIEEVVKFFNNHIEFANLFEHGYYVLTANNSRVQADFYTVDILTPAAPNASHDESYYSDVGDPRIREASALIPDNGGSAFPPENPVNNIPFALLLDTFIVNAFENQVLNTCYIQVSNICPNKEISIIETPEWGTASVDNAFCLTYESINNYYGNDYMTIIICDTALIPSCDTSVVQFNVIADNDIELLTYEIDSDSTLNDCPPFNDLVFAADTFNFSFNGLGSFSYEEACFTYTPQEDFNGVELAQIYACDSIGICDTIQLQFIVSGSATTQIIQINTNAGNLVSNCLGFDDFEGNLVNSDIIYNGVNGNTQFFNDTCFSYISNPNFNGTDTIIIYGCDDFTPQVCDTIVYWINVAGSNDTTSILELEEARNNDFAIIGIYPNPFDQDLLIQFTQFKNEVLTLNMYDMLGKKVAYSAMGDNSTGLKYFKINGAGLATGKYFIEISNGTHQYLKTVIKY